MDTYKYRHVPSYSRTYSTLWNMLVASDRIAWIHAIWIIIYVIEHRFYNLSAWERREVYQRTFYSTLQVDRTTGHVCFKKSESIILFHVGYLFPRYYLYATSNLVFIKNRVYTKSLALPLPGTYPLCIQLSKVVYVEASPRRIMKYFIQ